MNTNYLYKNIDVSAVHATNTRQKLLADVKQAVKQALAFVHTSNKSVISDDDPAGGVLCNALESTLTFGLKGTLIVFEISENSNNS